MHRKALVVAALLMAALAILPDDAVGQAKKKNNQQNKAQPATPQDYYLIQSQKHAAVQALLLSFDDASKTAAVRVDFYEWVPNPKYRPNKGAQNNLMRDYTRLMQEQSRIARSRNARQMQQHYHNMMNLQNRIAMDMQRAMAVNPNNMPFMRKDHLKDFELELEGKVVYRKMFLPQEFDDTGNLKKFSADEIKKLRGDNKPAKSYSADAGEFHPGQGVWVYLTPPKKAGGSSSSSSSSSSTKDKEDTDIDLKDGTVPRPTVNMLVIHTDGTMSPQSSGQGKKKKKN